MPLEILRYNATDILMNQNDVERLGFSKTKTFEEMVNLAQEHNCRILVKNGKGKWYLKGMGKSYEELKVKVDEKEGCMAERHNHNVILYLLKF
jgi:hypothetical protein